MKNKSTFFLFFGKLQNLKYSLVQLEEKNHLSSLPN